MTTKALLIDTSKCIGCRACQVACKQWNQLPAEKTTFNGNYENPSTLSPNTWMRITFKEVEENDQVEWYFGNNRCMHCTDAGCVLACPTGALYHTDGMVAFNSEKCIGCNYCAANCPFEVMSFDRRSNHPVKCTMCIDRTTNDFKPACVKACPTGTLQFGDRNEMINKASDRVLQLQAAGKNKARIYGLEEMSGTGTMFVLEDDPEHYGLPADPQVSFKTRAWSVIFKPIRVLAVLAVAFGLWGNRSETKKIQESSTSVNGKES